ncbi:hypothetical protein ACOSQ2_016041 [Xanthoceras sorbifolium]
MQQSPNIRWSDIYLGKESMSNALKYLAEASFGRGIATQDAGAFAWESTPLQVEVSGHERPSTAVDKDEGLRKFDLAKLRNFRLSIKETGGTVVAAPVVGQRTYRDASTVKKINRIRVTAFFHFGMWDAIEVLAFRV